MRTSRFSCRRVSLLGRPGENRTLRASAPCRRHAFRHRITELAAHLMRRATSFRDNSARRSFSARLPVGQQVGRTLGSHRDLQSYGDPIIALFYVRAIARKIAAITLIVWKKEVRFDANYLKQQAA